MLGFELFVDISCVLLPVFPFEVSSVEAPNIVVNSPCEFFENSLVNDIVRLLSPELRFRDGSTQGISGGFRRGGRRR